MTLISHPLDVLSDTTAQLVRPAGVERGLQSRACGIAEQIANSLISSTRLPGLTGVPFQPQQPAARVRRIRTLTPVVLYTPVGTKYLRRARYFAGTAARYVPARQARDQSSSRTRSILGQSRWVFSDIGSPGDCFIGGPHTDSLSRYRPAGRVVTPRSSVASS